MNPINPDIKSTQQAREYILKKVTSDENELKKIETYKNPIAKFFMDLLGFSFRFKPTEGESISIDKESFKDYVDQASKNPKIEGEFRGAIDVLLNEYNNLKKENQDLRAELEKAKQYIKLQEERNLALNRQIPQNLQPKDPKEAMTYRERVKLPYGKINISVYPDDYGTRIASDIKFSNHLDRADFIIPLHGWTNDSDKRLAIKINKYDDTIALCTIGKQNQIADIDDTLSLTKISQSESKVFGGDLNRKFISNENHTEATYTLESEGWTTTLQFKFGGSGKDPRLVSIKREMKEPHL